MRQLLTASHDGWLLPNLDDPDRVRRDHDASTKLITDALLPAGDVTLDIVLVFDARRDERVGVALSAGAWLSVFDDDNLAGNLVVLGCQVKTASGLQMDMEYQLGVYGMKPLHLLRGDRRDESHGRGSWRGCVWPCAEFPCDVLDEQSGVGDAWAGVTGVDGYAGGHAEDCEVDVYLPNLVGGGVGWVGGLVGEGEGRGSETRGNRMRLWQTSWSGSCTEGFVVEYIWHRRIINETPVGGNWVRKQAPMQIN